MTVPRMMFRLSMLLGLGMNAIVFANGAMLAKTRHEQPNQRSISFRNYSGRRVDVLWVNVQANPESFHSQNGGEGYPFGGDTNILSYIGHQFEVRELPSKRTGTCMYETCRTRRFKVNDQENQVFIVDKSFDVIHEDDRQQSYKTAQDIFDECQKAAFGGNNEEGTEHSSIQESSMLLSPEESIEELARCMEERVNEKVARKQEERDFQSNLRRQMADEVLPYACGDNNYTQSLEMQNLTFSHRELVEDEIDQTVKYQTKRYQIKLLHHRPSSEVFIIENFATPKQCKAIEAYIGKDGKVPFSALYEKTTQGIYLEQLAQKMFSLLRTRLGWEELEFRDMAKLGNPLFEAMIHEGETINAPTELCMGDEDEYEEDRKAGKCRLMGEKPLVVDTKPITIEKDTQLAQLYLFCEEPSTLGAMNFPYAGIHVTPAMGKLTVAVNRRLGDESFDGYVTKSHLCPNHHVYVNTIESI